MGVGPEAQQRAAYDYLMSLGSVATRFARVERAPRYPDGRRETDVEHSYLLGIAAIELAALLYPTTLNTGRVAEFCLVHDLPEVYAGDTPTFRITAEERLHKEAAEQAATQRLMAELPPHTAMLIRAYQVQEEPEARFVRLVDKVLPAVVTMVPGGVSVWEEDYGVTSADEMRIAREGHLASLRAAFPEFEPVLGVVSMVWDASIEHDFGSSSS